jgi:hypothetical protein
MKVGNIIQTKQGYFLKILEQKEKDVFEVEFQDDFKYRKTVKAYSLRTKGIKNPFHKTCYGVGYIGCEQTIKWVWKIWAKMMERCYSDYSLKFVTYKDVTVCKEWHNYKNFENWVLEKKEYREGFHLDKDIILKGNKEYSPDFCCFTPSRVNLLFTNRKNARGEFCIGVFKRSDNGKFRTRCYTLNGGINNLGNFETEIEAFRVYKDAKEKLIKEVAEHYKNEISARVYQALYSYKIEYED